MYDEVFIGSTPPEEECAQVGSDDYDARGKAECIAYIGLLQRTFGIEPSGARLYVKHCPHDFGTYYEVVCRYVDDDREAQHYACMCESDGPMNWDKIARDELVLCEMVRRGTATASELYDYRNTHKTTRQFRLCECEGCDRPAIIGPRCDIHVEPDTEHDGLLA